MFRLASFALLACAAFAWVPPGLDRPGTAALGAAFAALALGRYAPKPRRPFAPGLRGPALLDRNGQVTDPDLAATLAAARQGGDE